MRSTLAVVLLLVLYRIAPGHGEIAGLFLLLVSLAAAATAGLALTPWERLVLAGHDLPLFYAWSLADVLFITGGIAASGGGTSELYYLYLLTTIFFSVVCPPAIERVLILLTLASYLTVVALVPGEMTPAVLLFRVGLLGLVFVMTDYFSNQLKREAERHRTARAAIEHLAFHDSLTGLPNRKKFMRAVDEAITRSRGAGQPVSLLVLDLDHFKSINDTFGHDAGDQLLRMVAERLRQVSDEDDTVARLAGDEFTVLIEPGEGRPSAAEVAGAIVTAFQEPFALQGHPVSVTPSIGGSRASGIQADARTLLKAADQAMYDAKALGGRCYVLRVVDGVSAGLSEAA